MSRRGKRWLIGAGVVLAAGIATLFVVASILARRFEPFIREQAIRYMEERFDSKVELAALRIRMPAVSPLKMLLTRGRGVSAHVEGEGVSMRFEGARDLPPMFTMRKFTFNVDLGTLFEEQKEIALVSLEGMQIHVPPKGERPKLSPDTGEKPAVDDKPGASGVLIKEVLIKDAKLVILPKDKTKDPLDFDIHQVRLRSIGSGQPLNYEAQLTNPKPPGQIDSKGSFGPWVAREPSDTPLKGQYVFAKADLGVFSAIAGILNSKGDFAGTLSSIHARGEATVPDFGLKMSGNRVPLHTQFEVLVDGTNGNTVLQPVKARLGSTKFTTSGGVIKHEGDRRRTIDLDVNMPDGDLKDVLRLAMKGEPFMAGRLELKTKIKLPPLSGKVREKLELDGRFHVQEGKFLRSTIQEQIDQLSRRGQGQPGNERIDEVVSNMSGRFVLLNEVIKFHALSFGVPGAYVDLAGDYDLDRDVLDFLGALKLRARASQTMTGWKRWALKPVDPFLSKQGAGTFLRIKVEGTSKEPKFGLARGKGKDDEKGAAPTANGGRAREKSQ